MVNETKESPAAGREPAATGRRRRHARRAALVIAGALALVAVGFIAWNSFDQDRPTDGVETTATRYQCPMHPTIIQDAPGSCPICGMDLVLMEEAHKATPEEAVAETQYQCPMHPTIIRDQPGSCPICGMDLVPMAKRDARGAESAVPGLAAVSIDPEHRRRMGLRLGRVEMRELSREVRTSARVLVDETRQHRVTAKIEGWVDKLYVSTTGQRVKQGEPLLTIYSPELVSAQEEYLSSLATQTQLAAGNPDARAGGNRLAEAGRRRLELWDISEEQIMRLEKTGHVEKYLTLYAPASGWVIERIVLPGQKVMSSEPLLVIADLTRVWADADIYQSDLPHIQVGLPVELTLPAWPGKVITGKVTFLSPTLDPDTRTMRARLEVDNPELLLKPEMYATARLQHELGRRLAVPTSGIIFTGTRTLAFREGADHRLFPVEVILGEHSGDYYEVMSGLNEGDSVVVSANFLVDSESSIKAAVEALAGAEPGETPSEHSGH